MTSLSTSSAKESTVNANDKQPSAYSVMILLGLGAKTGNRQYPGHVYEGTADPARVAQRRAKNRVARKSRRVNRLRGAA
jgi:hypothetical protein